MIGKEEISGALVGCSLAAHTKPVPSLDCHYLASKSSS